MDAVSLDEAHFAALYALNDDPWQTRQSWYETRKRAIVCACLPHPHYGRIYEPACGTGLLTAALADRCHRLVASDLSERAVMLTRTHTAHAAHVSVHHAACDAAVEGAPFDLIVVSEVGYYLAAAQWASVANALCNLLAPTGTLLSCHWKPDFDDRRQSTHDVHAALAAQPGLRRIVNHEEPDFMLDVWTREAGTVAARDGRL